MNKKIFAPFVLVALSLSACSSNVAQAPAPAAPVVQVAQVPAGCPTASSLTAKTSDFKESTFTPVSAWFNVSTTTPESVQMVFGNYAVDKNSIYGHTYADTDALIVVKATSVNKTPIGVGNYSGAEDAKMKVSSVDIGTKNLSGAVFDKTGALEITYLDDKIACGTMKFDDSYSKLTGSFMATVNKR